MQCQICHKEHEDMDGAAKCCNIDTVKKNLRTKARNIASALLRSSDFENLAKAFIFNPQQYRKMHKDMLDKIHRRIEREMI